jgi:hypothetical protein
MSDVTDDLRAACLLDCQLPVRPDGPTEEELAVLSKHVHWRAADEIDRLRRRAAAAWQPIESAPKDGTPVLLFCPGLNGHVAREIVIGTWRFDANRRTIGYWVSDVGHLDVGSAESGPWIEYPELHPEKWAPLTRPE